MGGCLECENDICTEFKPDEDVCSNMGGVWIDEICVACNDGCKTCDSDLKCMTCYDGA